MKHLNLNKQMDDLDQIILNGGEFKMDPIWVPHPYVLIQGVEFEYYAYSAFL